MQKKINFNQKWISLIYIKNNQKWNKLKNKGYKMDLTQKKFETYKRKGNIKAAKIFLEDVKELLESYKNKKVSISPEDEKWLNELISNNIAVHDLTEKLLQLGFHLPNSTKKLVVGMVGIDPRNPEDKWFIHIEYFMDNYEMEV